MANTNSPGDLADVLRRLVDEQPLVEVDVSFPDIELKGFRGRVKGFSNEIVHMEADDGPFVKLPIRNVKWGYTATADFGPATRGELERQGIAGSLEVRKASNQEERYSITELRE
jgi:hypothetical protein